MKRHKRPRTGRATIDRFEDDIAVLLVEGRELHCARAELPDDAREGDVVDLEAGVVDHEATEQLRSEVRDARERARGRKPSSGSFDL
ncbi:MAG: DUF3006 domain-containing protein [Myxococcaceae bacterium]|nr:DUF3006 domain-containing protein [Myxococcaceae bacterium]MCI0670039.1 DUF3006 domain-containing protein [Myxococcaceae bacterium]